jgi:hypothetical protein
MSRSVGFLGGPRNLSDCEPLQLLLFTDAARAAIRLGYTVVTGASPGSEQAVTELVLEERGNARLVLPWKFYEKEWVSRMFKTYPDQLRVEVYDPCRKEYQEWRNAIDATHPIAPFLSEAIHALHARNCGVIAAQRHLVVLPSRYPDGCARQAVRLARLYNTPVYDLGDSASSAKLRTSLAWMHASPKKATLSTAAANRLACVNP